MVVLVYFVTSSAKLLPCSGSGRDENHTLYGVRMKLEDDQKRGINWAEKNEREKGPKKKHRKKTKEEL